MKKWKSLVMILTGFGMGIAVALTIFLFGLWYPFAQLSSRGVVMQLTVDRYRVQRKIDFLNTVLQLTDSEAGVNELRNIAKEQLPATRRHLQAIDLGLVILSDPNSVSLKDIEQLRREVLEEVECNDVSENNPAPRE